MLGVAWLVGVALTESQACARSRRLKFTRDCGSGKFLVACIKSFHEESQACATKVVVRQGLKSMGLSCSGEVAGSRSVIVRPM